MNPAIACLISTTFLISVGSLFVMLWGLANAQWGDGKAAAKSIFAEGEQPLYVPLYSVCRGCQVRGDSHHRFLGYPGRSFPAFFHSK